jgi:hypothetical protein
VHGLALAISAFFCSAATSQASQSTAGPSSAPAVRPAVMLSSADHMIAVQGSPSVHSSDPEKKLVFRKFRPRCGLINMEINIQAVVIRV